MVTVLRATREPPETRNDYWAEVLASSFSGLDVRFDEPPDARDRITVGRAGPLQVLESRSGPGEARRTARHIRHRDPDRYLLFVQAEGAAIGEQDGHRAEFARGDLGLVDLSLPVHCAYTERRAVMVSYPKALSPLREHEIARLRGRRIPGDTGTAALVSGLVRQLPRHLDTDDGADGALLGSAVLDLLNVGLATQLDRGDVIDPAVQARALVARCRGFIEEHLADPDLAPAVVAAAHHVSVRHLHRLFERSGEGVAALIRRRRLDRCRRDLLDPALSGRPVWAIGAQWGFADPAHFSRSFARAFGLPPAQFRSEYGGPTAAEVNASARPETTRPAGL